MFSTRAGTLLLLTMAAMMALSTAITLAALEAAGPPAAPLNYSAPRYAAEEPVLCPGEVLRWPVQLSVDAAPDRPVVTAIVRTVWSLDRNTTVVRDDAADYTIYFERTVISATVAYTVPLGLRPGSYEVRTGRLAEAREVRGYAVAFFIPARCA